MLCELNITGPKDYLESWLFTNPIKAHIHPMKAAAMHDKKKLWDSQNIW